METLNQVEDGRIEESPSPRLARAVEVTVNSERLLPQYIAPIFDRSVEVFVDSERLFTILKTEEAVETVEHTAMATDEGAEVLDVEVALEH